MCILLRTWPKFGWLLWREKVYQSKVGTTAEPRTRHDYENKRRVERNGKIGQQANDAYEKG